MIAIQPSKYGVLSDPVHFVATVTPREEGVLEKMATNGQVVYVGDDVPDNILRGIKVAKEKYGATAIDLKALIASKFVSAPRISKVVYMSDAVKMVSDGTPSLSGFTRGHSGLRGEP